MKWFLVPAMLVFICPHSIPAGDPMPVEFAFSNFQHREDTVTPEIVKDGVLLRVKSTTGIGYVTATPKKGSWPNEVTVLLEGLKELERFKIVTGRMVAEGSRGASGAFTLSMFGNDRDDTTRSQVGTLHVKVKQRKDGIAVIFPAKLFAGSDAATFTWIDWLRR